MVVVYPIILSEDKKEGGYIVSVPDFGITTEGENIAEAIYMARDAIGIMGIELEDENKELPKPYSRTIEKEEGDIETLVDVDLVAYRKKVDNRMVKKNCTIPYYLNLEAEKQGINFSRVLQEALVYKLGKNN